MYNAKFWHYMNKYLLLQSYIISRSKLLYWGTNVIVVPLRFYRASTNPMRSNFFYTSTCTMHSLKHKEGDLSAVSSASVAHILITSCTHMHIIFVHTYIQM